MKIGSKGASREIRANRPNWRYDRESKKWKKVNV